MKDIVLTIDYVAAILGSLTWGTMAISILSIPAAPALLYKTLIIAAPILALLWINIAGLMSNK